MLLVCVRHLPTEWNARELLQGQRDIDLIEPDAAALEGVERNKRRLLEYGRFDRVFTSRLRRTQRTAELHGYVEFTVEPLLDELAFGDWEGKSREEFGEEFGDRWRDDPRDLVLGESLEHLHGRIGRFLAKYASCGQALVFGHGSWLRALRSIMKHGDVRAMNKGWIDNNEILEFSLPGQGR